ncbi:MAG TPA: hypothetical protein VJ302_17620 [Blastocatellia bacterium]|nr:hypothetical protein [Blastocatellia bacterium]
MTKYHRLASLLLLFSSAVVWPALPVHGQARDRAAIGLPRLEQVQTFPEYLIYGQFLAHLKHLDDKSKNPNRKPGEDLLSEHYKKKLQLTQSEYQKCLQIAADRENEMRTHLTRRLETINRLRARTPDRRLASRDQLPPLPEEIKQLQREYEEMLSRYANRLKSEFTPARMNQIDAVLKRTFGSQIQVLKVDVPRDRAPEKQKPPAFEQ